MTNKKNKTEPNLEKNRFCSICREEFEGFGNNAEPINNGICCNDCNALVVIPARIKMMTNKK